MNFHADDGFIFELYTVGNALWSIELSRTMQSL